MILPNTLFHLVRSLKPQNWYWLHQVKVWSKNGWLGFYQHALLHQVSCLIYRGLSFCIATDGNNVICLFFAPSLSWSDLSEVTESWCAGTSCLPSLPSLRSWMPWPQSLQWAPATDHMPPATACGQWREGSDFQLSLVTCYSSKCLTKTLNLKCSLQKKQQMQSGQEAKCHDSRSDGVYEEESLKSAPFLSSFSFPSPSLPPFSVDSSSSDIDQAAQPAFNQLCLNVSWVLASWNFFQSLMESKELWPPAAQLWHWTLAKQDCFPLQLPRKRRERLASKGDKLLWEFYRSRCFVFIGNTSYVKREKMLQESW